MKIERQIPLSSHTKGEQVEVSNLQPGDACPDIAVVHFIQKCESLPIHFDAFTFACAEYHQRFLIMTYASHSSQISWRRAINLAEEGAVNFTI